MAHANITDPEVLKTFRHHYVKYDEECRQALSAVRSDVFRAAEWLKREQMAHWKRQLRRCEDMAQQARLDYNRAVHGEKYHGKSSGVDERKLLERAMRAKEEAEQKLANVKRWSVAIENEAGKLLGPCMVLESLMERMTPQALARLDQMIDSLDDYLRPSGHAGSGSAPSAASSESTGSAEGAAP
ncbi:MAG: hypothetical protein M5U26_16005 [Planctomycetota bacterium]|nr:hypothetical protein [Planctomycetota bacterium]